MKKYEQVKSALREAADSVQAVELARFFKTGKGGYGEGDVFWGIKVPVQRAIARKHTDAALPDIGRLLNEPVHECRLTALLILVEKYSKSDCISRKEIFDFYLSKTGRINNWDLVDLSAPKIVGHYLLDKDRSILHTLAASSSLWEQRIAVVSTYSFIRNSDYADTIKICESLLGHTHDLIHKATGWMLREAGKRDEKVLIEFLDKHHKSMPRTMLRYSIEKLDESLKKKYMAK